MKRIVLVLSVGALLVVALFGRVLGREIAHALFDRPPRAASATLPDQYAPFASEEGLKLLAEGMNRTLPKTTSSGLEVFEAAAESKTLIYRARFLNFTVAELDQRRYAEATDFLIKTACAGPEMMELIFKQGRTLRAEIYDKNKTKVTSVDVTIYDCTLRQVR